MSRQESEDQNFLSLARSPVKRTPRGYAPAPAGEGLSGTTTARMSTEGSVRSVGSSTSAASEARHRHNVLRPLAGNSMLDNSVYRSGGAARTPGSASPLDMMSLTISSKKKAVAAARRTHLSVSRTLKLSPAVDTTGQHQQESVMADAHTAVEGGSMPYSETMEAGSMPYSETTVDHTQYSITQSALFSALDRLPPTPHGDASCSNQGKNSNPVSGALNNNYRIQPSTPPAPLGETDFLEGGDISNIDEGRSGAWSDCSFTNAVFSPDPATPRLAHGGSNGIDGTARGASVKREQAPAREVSPIMQEEGPSPPAAEIAMRAISSTDITNAHPPSTTTASACTPGAVSALLRMGGHSVGTAPTPDSIAADASRYRGYVARSPLATSGASSEECGENGRGFDVPNTPAAAATLAAMMMDTNGSVRESGTGTAAVTGEDEEVRSFAEEDEMKGDDETVAMPTGVQMHQPKQPTPETPSRRDNVSAMLPIITPRRRKAASQLLDLSKATPKKLIRGIIGGWNGPPVQAGKQRKQYTRFVPQVAKLVEGVEEETPRTLLKGICTKENPLDFTASRTGCNSMSVAEAAAAAAAAAAASTAAAAAAAAVAESAKVVGDRAEAGGAGDAGVALPHPTVQPPGVASSPAATAVVVHSSISAKGNGNGFLKIVLSLILLVLLVCGALSVAEDVAVVVCLVFAGPPLAQPIY